MAGQVVSALALTQGKGTAEKNQVRSMRNYNRVQEPRQAQLMDFGVMQTWVRILLLPLAHCVTLEEFHSQPGPQFPHLQYWDRLCYPLIQSM